MLFIIAVAADVNQLCLRVRFVEYWRLFHYCRFLSFKCLAIFNLTDWFRMYYENWLQTWDFFRFDRWFLAYLSPRQKIHESVKWRTWRKPKNGNEYWKRNDPLNEQWICQQDAYVFYQQQKSILFLIFNIANIYLYEIRIRREKISDYVIIGWEKTAKNGFFFFFYHYTLLW